MSVKKFKFVSPGVFVNEVDNSQLPAVDTPAGPIIIGRLPRGPGMKPVKVDSFSRFVEVFGNPVSGRKTGDVWREGNYQGPTYSAYAAQAYLAAGVGSINVVRLLGYENEDAVAAGAAGWETVLDPSPLPGSNGGAYGLFIAPSSSAGGSIIGSLAAIWYLDSGSSVLLSGTQAGSSTIVTGTAGLINSAAGSDPYEFTAMIYNGSTSVHKTSFNFDKSSQKFIRNVFNTNPQTVNSTVVPTTNFTQGEQHYWLGESFSATTLNLVTGSSAIGFIMPLDGKNEYRQDAREAHTGWFFSQDLTNDFSSYSTLDMQKLFRFHALDAGQWSQEALKISIQDLTYSRNTSGVNPFGTFTVVIRKADDTDNVVEIIERYSNCNLNPLSANYVARRIGDRYMLWDASQRRLKTYGNYSNVSSYIRIEMIPEVENSAVDPKLLPYGVLGPPKYHTTELACGSLGADTIIKSGSLGAFAIGLTASCPVLNTGSYGATTVEARFPSSAVRLSASAGGLSDPKNAYFGLNVSSYQEIDKISSRESRPDPGYGDYLYPLGDDFAAGADDPSGNAKLDYQWVVSLDDLVLTGTSNVYWKSGSRADGDSMTCATGSDWQEVIDQGYTRFTSPLFNGFDGLNITEIEPFRNTLLDNGGGPTTDYANSSIRRAVDTVRDAEFVECNLITMPGLTNAGLTEHIIQVCEDRGDALALIDIPHAYTPFTEGTAQYASVTARVGTVSEAVSTLENREINSSYGCTYYPWVQIRDTIDGALLWVPPSVVALGTFASSEAATEIWFAPAGFNRGGLTEGSSGLPVLSVSDRLTSQDRDNLYEANINPIASFPNEGIVIFGQKTLQSSQSALDRINVRRMMIFVKKRVSVLAKTILFDQNVRVTWNRFISKADPFLRSVQNRLGISEYRLILDESTTTPDLVDQNIVYAKIFIKPTKAIEYIAIDFVLTNQGAGFED
jgi:hypothetical protein